MSSAEHAPAQLPVDLGARIRADREAAGLTPTAAAAAVARSERSVTLWEAGRVIPGRDVLIRLALVLGVPPTRYLAGDEAAGVP